ncbi:MAG: SoxR reducing system RseC family protein [Clostridia bacterium]|nr:SoxR reducing system RseC family protein [Clostridia bacterium]
MTQTGIVEEVSGEYISVRIKRDSACGGNCASCGAGCTGAKQTVIARNDAYAKVGDTVVLQMRNCDVLLAAFLVYIFPLIMLFAVYFISFRVFAHEGISMVFGILSMCCAFFLVKLLDKRLRNKYILIATSVL